MTTQPKAKKATAKKAGGLVPHVIRFRSKKEHDLVYRAAEKEQAAMKDVMRQYPNVTIFVLEATRERVKRVLGVGD